MSYRSTVECYDCHRQVADLKSHRSTCSGKKGSKRPQRGGIVECYDCHEQVADLKSHRSVCMKKVGHSPLGGTVECYDCHEQVADLKSHRKICPRAPLMGAKGPKDNTRDVYFLIDVSGSMAGSKLTESKNTITNLFADMPEDDRIAIVAFDSGAFFKLRLRRRTYLRQDKFPLAAAFLAVFLLRGHLFSYAYFKHSKWPVLATSDIVSLFHGQLC